MRALLGIVLVAVVALIIGIMTGFINLNAQGGKLPEVSAKAGSLPDVDVTTGKIDLGTRNTTVEVPKVTTEKETVKVPTISVKNAEQK